MCESNVLTFKHLVSLVLDIRNNCKKMVYIYKVIYLPKNCPIQQFFFVVEKNVISLNLNKN